MNGLGAAGGLPEILAYDQHLAVFLLQYAGTVRVRVLLLGACFSHRVLLVSLVRGVGWGWQSYRASAGLLGVPRQLLDRTRDYKALAVTLKPGLQQKGGHNPNSSF